MWRSGADLVCVSSGLPGGGVSCLCLLSVGIAGGSTTPPSSSMGSGYVNFVFHTCMANTLPSEPSLSLLLVDYLPHWIKNCNPVGSRWTLLACWGQSWSVPLWSALLPPSCLFFCSAEASLTSVCCTHWNCICVFRQSVILKQKSNWYSHRILISWLLLIVKSHMEWLTPLSPVSAVN